MTMELLKSMPKSELSGAVEQALDRAPARVRVALIGCGAIAKALHLPVLAGHEGMELAALVDRDVGRARELANGYGVKRVVQDASELSASDIDAAIVASPPAHHAPCTMDLLRRGIHVLVEKPMATHYADAEAMVRLAEEQHKVLSVGFFRRLNPSIRLMKSVLDSGWLGRPLQFAVEGGGMYNWAAATLANMKKELSGGGVLIDFGTHMLDLLFALFEEPADVLDYRDNALGGVEADCSIRLRLRHSGDPVEGTVELARTRELGNFIRVTCERGTLEFEVNERHRIRVTPAGPTFVDPVNGAERPYRLEAHWLGEDENESWYETFRRQIDDWLDAIRNGREPVLSGRSALPTSRLIEACYQQKKALADPWVWVGTSGCAYNGADRVDAGSILASGAAKRPQRVLVTGASGFIGCRVVELLRLREACEVRALVHNPGNASRLARLDAEMVHGSLDKDANIAKLVEGCDAIVHCAIGTTFAEPRKIYDVTVGGTRRLVNAAMNSGVRRFVHLSTISVYGDDSTMTGMLDEETPIRPAPGSWYGDSKAQAEKLVRRAASRGLSSVILRPARVFGPFARTFITRPIQAIANKQFRWLGSPDVACDMVYVDNVVEAILRSLVADDRVAGESFVVGEGLRTTWREFYEEVAAALNLDLDGVSIEEAAPAHGRGWLANLLLSPVTCVRGIKSLLTSPEFKALGRRMLQTDGVGTLPRWALERIPGLERGVRRLVRANASLPIHRREKPLQEIAVEMGSGGAVVNIDKARRLLGYKALVSPEQAVATTLDWVRSARIV